MRVSLWPALSVFLAFAVFALLALGFGAKPAAAATCTDSLQAKINAAPRWGTVRANPCVYREQVVVSKPITLEGQPGTEIRGSEIWSTFYQREGLYVSKNAVPGFSANGQCEPNTYDCLKPEQVFIEGTPLKQVANGATPLAGQFSLDSGRHVVLKDNPWGKMVEVSTRRNWVIGRSPDVTIKNFRMRHAANDSQWRAALSNENHANWTLQNSVLSDSHGSLVSFREAGGLKVLNNELYRAGQTAVHSSHGGITISGNRIHDNNTSNFRRDWEAGGVKTIGMSSVLAENNTVWNNNGRGLWCDLDCRNVTYRGNRLYNNAYSGIFFEISHGAKIYDNVLYENGWGKPAPAVGGWEAAIEIYSSRNAEVYNNTVAWNRSGISTVRVDRRNALYNDVYGNYVHDNQIFSKDYPSTVSYGSAQRNHALTWEDGLSSDSASAGSLFDPAKNNRGYSNDYYFLTAENPAVPRFMWGDGITSLAVFNSTRGEDQGRYLSQAEKDSMVANKGIPAYPQR